MDKIKSNIKGVVGSSTNGILLTSLENDYYNVTNSRLDFQSLGYKSLIQFLQSIPDVIKIVMVGGKSVIRIATTKDDPECLRTLSDFVDNSLTKKNHQMNGARAYKQNKKKSFKKPLHIMVKNDLCAQSMSDVQLGFSIVKNNSNTNTPEDENLYHSLDSSTNCSSEYFDTGSWLVRPVINYEVFDKQIKILGVQSGHALVVPHDIEPCSCLMQSRNVTTVYPGDIVLWQPPFYDAKRVNNVVDINSSFPATVIKRTNTKLIQIRVMGLVTMLEVCMCDLFKMPVSGELCDLIRNIQTREITLVSMALIPTSATIWDQDAFNDVYNVLFSIEENGSLLERSNERGNFLNVSLLRFIEEKLVLTKDVDEKRKFLAHITSCLDRSLKELLPSYQRMLSGSERTNLAVQPLCLAHSLDDCLNTTLIGSKSVRASPQSPQSSPVCIDLTESDSESAPTMALRRVEYRSVRSAFVGVDDRSPVATLTSQWQWPLTALFVVNENFIRSGISNMDNLRFRSAILATLPGLGVLTADLGLDDS